MLNPDTLWANGEGLVIRSFDGGATWDSLAVDTSKYRITLTIQFSADGHGTAFSYDGIYESADFGNTWEKLTLPNINISSFTKIGTDSILVSTNKDLLRSTDRGATWSFSKKDNIQMLLSRKNIGIIALLSNGSVHKSTDFGATWAELYKPSKEITPIAIHVIDDSKWFISYNNGIVAHTTNSGESWIEPQNPGMFGYKYG